MGPKRTLERPPEADIGPPSDQPTFARSPRGEQRNLPSRESDPWGLRGKASSSSLRRRWSMNSPGLRVLALASVLASAATTAWASDCSERNSATDRQWSDQIFIETNPRFSIRPDLGQYFPSEALAAGVTSGSTTLACITNGRGDLTDCRVISETPAGLGFGSAALMAAAAHRHCPYTAEGRPLRSELRL